MNRRARRRRVRLERGREGGLAVRRGKPGRPDLEELFQAATGHQEAGRLDESEALCTEIIRRDPAHADARDLLGVVHALSGRTETAAALMAEAIALSPGIARYHNNLGNVLGTLGRPDDAIAAYGRALELRPADAQTLNNLGTVLKGLGRLDEARSAYEDALAINPHYAEAYSNYGNVLMDAGRIEDAVACQRRSLELNPVYAVAHNNLGNGLKRLGQYEAAGACFRRALEIAPDYGDALNNLGEALREQGEAAEAIAHYRRSLAVDPGRPGIHSNLLLALNCLADIDRAAVFAEHRRWAARHAGGPSAGRADHANHPDPDRTLRVGYVSPDFRMHSVAYFIEPVLEAHDRHAAEVFCYASGGMEDPVTERLRGHAEGWRSIHGMGDADAAELVRRDGIDILVDLAGHTMDSRLSMFALKPAPVQVSYLGYPNTTGMDAVDYRLTDAWADPEGSEAFHTERLIRLAGGFLCYRPPGDAPPVAPLAADAADAVTFASCNNLAKVTAEVIAAWAAILDRVPGARLLIKAKPLGDEGTRRRLLGRLARHGVAPDRAEMMGWVASGSHLGVYGRIDIGLDTFPYNGTTTTCEASWMGVPVVTLAGDRHAGRVGVSLLSRIGLGEMIAASVDDYIEVAVALAGDRTRLRDLRGGMRGMIAASGLTDGKAFAAGLEAAWRTVWREWCRVRRP